VNLVPAGARSLSRAFVAVVPPPEVLDAVGAAVAPVRREWPDLRWTPRAQWHVTLQFLGPVEDPDALVEGLREAMLEVAPFPVGLGGGGAFARERAATVLWAGVATGMEELGDLASVVARATARLGFAPEGRPYRPHVTLARSARVVDLRAAVGAFDAAPTAPPWTVGEVVLFDRETGHERGHERGDEHAVHSVVARCPLTARRSR
jgi:2'-5' RNA ligase